MKEIIQNLNDHIRSNTSSPYNRFDVAELITGIWSCNLKRIVHRTRNIINFDNILILRWTRDTIELLYHEKLLYKSPPINTEQITVSFALKENLIRIQGSKDFDGTYKLSPSDILNFKPKELTLHVANIISFGEAGVFSKEEALKNMSGLELWIIPDKNCMVYSGSHIVSSITDISHNNIKLEQIDYNFCPSIDPEDRALTLNPSQFLINKETKLNIGRDYILFIAFEPYEFVSPIQEQMILKLSNEKYSNEYYLTFSEEEFGNSKDLESLRRLYVTQKINVNNNTYEEVNFVDMLSKNWLIRNERPGPPIYFISTQTNKEDKTIIQNYNYNGKWFMFDELEFEAGNNIEENVNIQVGGTYQGKIKEIFLFNRKLVSDDAFDDQSIKWIMAYLKQKYAITDTLIKLK